MATQRPFLLLQNLLIASKQPHNSLSCCCCSMLVSIDVLKHLQRSHTPHHGPLIRLRLRLHSFFTGPLILNYNRMVGRELLIMVVQDLEDIYSTVSKNLCALFNIQDLGSNYAGTERRKTHEYIYIYIYIYIFIYLFIIMQSVCSKHTRTHAYKHVHCDLNSKSYDLMFKWVKTFTKILLWLAVVIIVMFTILCRGLHTVSVSVSVCVVSYIQIWEACEKCKIVAQFKWSFRHVPEGYCCRCCCCRCCCCCFCCRLVLCNAVDCRKTA